MPWEVVEGEGKGQEEETVEGGEKGRGDVTTEGEAEKKGRHGGIASDRLCSQ